MKTSFTDKNTKNDPGSQKISSGEYEPRAAELTELLGACRNLSDILNSEELYAAFAGIIEQKFEVHKLGLFEYNPKKEDFMLVLSHGLGKLEYKFKPDKQDLWHTILQNKPFAVVDGSGNPLFTNFLEKQDLKILPSELWVPLVMRDDVMGLLAGLRAYALKRFVLRPRVSRAAVVAQTSPLVGHAA